ncbi:MAG TPA: hypothetical protein VJK49_02775, partial [Candidatus Limnocylindrales bacterium]|nr:hypothetical protein [Candidatus Limnocylindrales bacterium]
RAVQFNSDSGNNYQTNQAFIIANAVTDAQLTNQAQLRLDASSADADAGTFQIAIGNHASVNKGVRIDGVRADAGSTDRFFGGGIWANAVDQVTTVAFILEAAGNYNSGSRAWCEGR